MNQKASSLSIFGLDGKELYNFLDIEGNFNAFLKTGIYLLHVVIDDKTTVQKMFVR